ncbi:hypothetical protein U9M48_044595 [Paspalum notatum var. saurae]|uniref:Uncharacterized protein n=1 Tax=Paspalum notatum var. saurae TaxID=547442 RepID=A0AAQ3XJP8_PASNO
MAAAAGAPFSIREYAARARPVGGAGGWPFGGEGGALPPVEVRRFRWWEDEAAAADEEEVERRMAAKRRKRSVAELFAAVPRVARGNNGCGKGKGKAGKRKLGKDNKGKPGLAVVGVKVASKGSKTEKKKKVPAGIYVKVKDKSNGVKATSIGISQSFQHSIRKRKPKNNISKQKGNHEVSILLDKKSKKGKRKSVLDRYKKAIVNSVQAQSICKTQPKARFNSVLDSTDIRFKLNSSCKPKHATFSDGTDTFRWTARVSEDDREQTQSAQISQRSTQESPHHHNTDEQQLAYQQADAMSGAVENASSLSENVVSASAGVYRTVPLTKPKDRTMPSTSVDLNQCIETSNSSNCMNSISLACLSSKAACQNFNGVGSCLDGYNGLNVESLGEQNHMISQASFNPVSLAAKAISADRSLLSQPSSSSLYDTSRSTLRESLVTSYQLGRVRPQLLRSGKDVVRSINSSTGSNKSAGAQATDCVSACRNVHFSDDYVGLPINSRGEFIKVHPGGTPNSVDTFKRQILGENSSCPSAFPTIFTHSACTDRVNLRSPSHHAQQICTVDQSVFHADPRFTPIAPTTYGTDFGQLPNSERTKNHHYTIPSNKYPCTTNQQKLSVECFCSGCMGHLNPQHKLLGMQNFCLSQNRGQSTHHNAETTMRLMGKTVALGTSAVQCRGLNEDTTYSSKQARAEDQFFQGSRTKVFPQLFRGGLVDPASSCKISDGDRQTPGKPSHFSFVPAAESSLVLDTSSLKSNGHSQQPELATTNSLYAHPGDRSNEGEGGHRQPVMANQVQGNDDNLLLGSMQSRPTQTIAPESSFNTRNRVQNFMEQRPAPYQSGWLTQQLSNMSQRTPASSFASGYAVQKTPGSTTQTKFTSLRPLPPSVIPSHVYSAYYAPPPLGSVTSFHPSAPVPCQPSNSIAPGNAMFEDESMRWAMIGSMPEGLEHLRNCKRPREQDGALLTLPKKPCTAARREVNMPPFPADKGVEFRGSRPDAQPRDMAEPEADLRLGNREPHPTWSDAVNTMRPVNVKPAAERELQPSGSSAYQENAAWRLHGG